ncbi:uncharacterized protein LOC101861667 [Aplysia californica]|uniref:Uncharacterized protein LOC101861667 n=1 Tax=Aplysia californica TaxID=6500 RepID=A0ABM1A2N3_APLCA|nr:uncharacterized protein LOC101861667 [Aplysia californica]XP_012939619.1 uncharacterized protein LOC101861667 [Aplysia californica]XP_012939621.1 uncharacterized protein LOC101861667 [Aplysia californica]
MAGTVDPEAQRTALMALSVIFIIGILVGNFALLYIILRRGCPLMNTRKFLIFTLAGGDILLALYSLIIFARKIFEKHFRLNCETEFVSMVYWNNYLPFVYGVGLLVLCGELCFRRKLRSTISNPCLASILVAAVPWIVGLILILPLTLAGFDTQTCRYDDSMTIGRLRAVVVISMVLPSVLAVIFALITNRMKIEAIADGYDTPSPEGTFLSEITTMLNAQVYPLSSTDANGQSEEDSTFKQAAYLPQTMPPTQAVALTPVSATQPASDQQDVQAAVSNEQTTLVVVAFVHAILTLPYALYTLSYIMNEDRVVLDPLARVVLGILLQWMVHLRSILTPIVWLLADRPPMEGSVKTEYLDTSPV